MKFYVDIILILWRAFILCYQNMHVMLFEGEIITLYFRVLEYHDKISKEIFSFW